MGMSGAMKMMFGIYRERHLNRYAPAILLVMAAIAGVSGCSLPAKAQIDYRYSGQFVWPGPPEKPRVQYLWSLYSFVPEGGNISEYINQDEGGSDLGDLPYMLKPFGVYAGKNGNLYIVDQGIPRVSVINLKTREIIHLGFDGIGKLLMPIGIAVDRTGRMYVTDSEAARVKIFDPSGTFSGYLGGEEFFRRPTGIAIDENTGRIIVLDTVEHKAHVFDAAGSLLFSFGKRGNGDGEFNYPTHIAVGRDGRIYVNDAMNFRIQIFDRDGKFITVFGKLGDAYGDIEKAKGIAVDTFGHIYVVDTMQEMIKIFDDKGQLLLFFGGQGRAPGMFSMPAGISIDDQNTIFIADMYNQKIQVFKLIEENVR